MEVGAVKQSFNNEVILLKKKLSQAKTQIIHKLTRKAKTFTEKKCPEPLKEKLKRKAEAAVNEVLIIKTIKAKDVAKFSVTHKGNLNDYINKPEVNHDKACARLLLHKALRDKYELLRTRYSNIPITDLFMSRQERRKLKKEAKKNKKEKGNTVSDGDWIVSDVDLNNGEGSKEGLSSKIESEASNSEIEYNSSNEENIPRSILDIISEASLNNEIGSVNDDVDTVNNQIGVVNSEGDGVNNEVGKFVRINKPQKNKLEKVDFQFNSDELEASNKLNSNSKTENQQKLNETKMKSINKIKNKSKNLNEKIISRKFNKSDDFVVEKNKVVDPFFITATGENYMSVVEPRPPDEFKEIHRQGNRKLRRAAMFGHVPKLKSQRNDKFSKERNYNKHPAFKSDHKYSENGKETQKPNLPSLHFKGKANNLQPNIKSNLETEKLHPSWEAKRKQSTILPFQGKKVIFDDG